MSTCLALLIFSIEFELSKEYSSLLLAGVNALDNELSEGTKNMRSQLASITVRTEFLMI